LQRGLAGSSKRKRKKKDKSLPHIAKLISWLDGYAALSCVDPVKIDKMVKDNSDDEDLTSIWKSAKDDVYEIGNLPSSSPEILRLAKFLNITKMVFLFLGIGLILLWLVLERLGVFFFASSRLSSYVLVIVIIVFYNVNIFIFTLLNRRLNSKIADYYHKHGGEVKKQRIHLRQLTQQLIDRLTLRVRRMQYDAADYVFTLFHSDYNNIRIIKEGKNGIYTAIVEARTRKEIH
jgi:hypothetical protein